jgi:hypothetical protein
MQRFWNALHLPVLAVCSFTAGLKLFQTAETYTAVSERLTCSRTATSCVRCPMCTSGALRTERPQWSWIWAAPTVSLEERHGQTAV